MWGLRNDLRAGREFGWVGLCLCVFEDQLLIIDPGGASGPWRANIWRRWRSLDEQMIHATSAFVSVALPPVGRLAD